MHRRLLSLLFCFLLPVIASAGAKRAFTIEDLYRIHGIEDLHVSPDGKTILFTLQTSDLAKAKRIEHVWLMDADGRNARQFTSGEKGESSPIFSRDGKWMAFVSSRDGGDNLYIISTSGGEARQLTNISTGVSDPLWSPDRVFERRLSGMRRRRCLQQEDQRALEQGPAPRPHGRCAAVPPLDAMERR
jgi:dipeptidyl aminopeptidase/acylaminoacyl peptidase